ncbi:hypothetical protein I316_05184 [Kwoniella heveanensis BCC8398]|uniref:SET domain-containing protein n=1 Tax=Kwoniella heveanensis BCC8398 TaxID=1296120 RepID=A0A1B9GPW6_9TREE|nr:hypothetical protein I316_05184 [Kwoniella heveanensis BCC8398]
MSEAQVFDPQGFWSWFKRSGGWYDETLLGLKSYAGMGYGAVALKDVPEDAPLFHIPDTLILSPFNSDLKTKLSGEEWGALDRGWCRLILTMMYETQLGEQSRWSGYLSNMPTEFDTPMLWNEEERQALAGTDIQDRIGKEDADKEYETYLLPVIKAHPELFPPSSAHSTLAAFHLQGSRVLSRSFTVPLFRFDPSSKNQENDDNGDGSDISDIDDDEGEQVAVMIPFADMLNAAFERDNAHLYGSSRWEKGFTMKSTKAISKGDQIYNTYASPPNAELLRKYGHVDVLPLPTDSLDLLTKEEIGGWPYGNAGDEVLLDGKLVVEAVAEVLGSGPSTSAGADDKWRKSVEKRVDWWLDEGLEDSFPLSLSPELDDELIQFIRLLAYDAEWMRCKKKGKLPTSMMDARVAAVVLKSVEMRKSGYKGSIQTTGPNTTPTELRKTYAAVVRLGEKRILNAVSRLVEELSSNHNASKKRKAEGEDEGKGKGKGQGQ